VNDKVCIVGAGSSGIAAVKVLAGRGIGVDCFEAGSGVGGNWRYENDNGMSSAYASLHINTSKTLMQYSDFPMPAEYPDYPHHAQILRYFESYVDRFGFRDRIAFRTRVLDIAPAPDGGFAVTIEPHEGVPETRRYRAVVVASGHHWDPSYPSFPGELAPSVSAVHAHHYRTLQPYAGKRVLVVGIGNSAVDIACEVCRVATRTVISTRRSAHIFPKYIFGRPTDHLISPRMARLPQRLQIAMVAGILKLVHGDQSRFGVPEPAHSFTAAHPTVSEELLSLVGHGRVAMKPDIASLEGTSVRFVDGSTEPFDAVVWATGYRISFPFFRPEVLRVEGNDVRLYRRVVHPSIRDLYFIGLVQPLGAIMPLAEIQSKWIAGLVRGEIALPDRAAMAAEIDAYRASLRDRYVTSPRHTIQVDFWPYIHELENEMRDGRRRVARA
jgi:hypothetical protein